MIIVFIDAALLEGKDELVIDAVFCQSLFRVELAVLLSLARQIYTLDDIGLIALQKI